MKRCLAESQSAPIKTCHTAEGGEMFKTTRQLKRRSKIWLAPWNIYSTGLGLILWAFLATNLWAGWRSEVIYTGSNQIFNFAIGDARNDGHPRIYAQMANLGLVELGYLGEGQWSFDVIYILPSQSAVGFSQANNGNEQSNLVVGPGRNDGVNRIYLCPYDSDSLYEFTYSNGNWVKRSEKILEDPSTVLLLKIEQARNDDTFRVNAYNFDQRYAPDTLYELTWRNGNWDVYRIPLPNDASGGYFTEGKGRNDDTIRLYLRSWPSPLELTYRGEWFVDTLHSVPYIERYLLMANGHSDGLNRLYGQTLAVVDLGMDTLTFYEIAYQNGKWETEIVDQIISEIPPYYSPMSLGSGKNDDTIRLYVRREGNIWEYTYRNLWTKEKVSSDSLSGYLLLHIGKGRGDDTNRLYVYENAIIEFSYSPTGIGENKKVSQKITQPLLITPNTSSGGFKIEYEVSEAPVSLRIYDVQGRVVRKLVEGSKNQGRYQIYWDGKDDKGNDVGEGIFFCQLKSGGNTLSKKLIRLK